MPNGPERTSALITSSRLFVIVAGLVAAGTFVFSLLSDFKRTNEDDIRIWQKTIMYKIVSDTAPEPVSFADIKQKYVTEATANQQLDVPKEELDDTVTRRILLELVADGALKIAAKDSYSINTMASEFERHQELVQEFQKLHKASLDSIQQEKINELQRAIVFEIILSAAPESINFENIQSTYFAKLSELKGEDFPRDQLHSNVTRRVLFELMSDSAIIQTASDEYSLNDVQAKQAKQAEVMLQLTNASLKRSEEFNEESLRREKIGKRIIELVSDKPGGYSEADLVRTLQREESIETAEAVLAVHHALDGQIIVFDHRSKGSEVYLRMDLPQ